MSAVYSLSGEVLADGLQGSRVCDEAWQSARRIAIDIGEEVHLVDDDGEWIVPPSGRRRPHVSDHNID